MSAVKAPTLTQVPLSSIHVHHNVRHSFDQAALEELAASLRQFGVLEPLLLRPLADGYALVAGERRLRAATIAGLETVPAIISEMDEAQAAKLQLLENLQRADLDPVEEAGAYELLIETHGMKAKDLAKELGVSESQISNRRRLLRLPAAVQESILRKKLSATVALNLVDYAEYPDVAAQLAEDLVEEGATQANVAQVLGDVTQDLPTVSGPSWEHQSCDADAHGNCPCRRKLERHGRSVAICLDPKRFEEIEQKARARILAKTAEQKQGAVEGDARIDVNSLKWNDYGENAQYRRLNHCKGDHGACACKRQATVYGQEEPICVDPKAFDKIERAAVTAANAKVRQTVKSEQEEASAWALQRVEYVTQGCLGSMVPLHEVDLAYLAAWVLTACEAEYSEAGTKRADKREYLRGLGVQWDHSGVYGRDASMLAERLTALPRGALLRIIVEWPLLAEAPGARTTPSLGHWYRMRVDADDLGDGMSVEEEMADA